MAFPKRAEWSERVYSAGARGFNFLVDFENEMWRVFPQTQDYNFGKFMQSDINNVMIEGWKHLTAEMYGLENLDDWNSKVGLRFSLNRDVHGHVMYGDEYVMIMHKEYRNDIVLPERLAANKRAEQTAKDAATYVHPEDPERNKMQDRAAELAEQTSSVRKVKAPATSGPNLGGDTGGDVW